MVHLPHLLKASCEYLVAIPLVSKAHAIHMYTVQGNLFQPRCVGTSKKTPLQDTDLSKSTSPKNPKTLKNGVILWV